MTPHLSFADDLLAFSQAGVDGIGIAAGEVGYGRAKLRNDTFDLELFRNSGLKAVFCNPEIPSILPRRQGTAQALGRGPEDPGFRIDKICASIERLAKFDPVCCICVPGPQGTYVPDQAWEIAVVGLKQVARRAANVGVKIAIEPMHPSIADDFSFVTAIPDAVALLRDVDEPNVGLLFDVWHLWDSPDVTEQIRAHARQIIGVHLNDWREPTRSWCDRVLPGDGLADYIGILSALRDGGFDGWFELEVLSDDGTFGSDFPDSLWKSDPVQLISEGRRRFLELWGRAAEPSNASPAVLPNRPKPAGDALN